MEIFDSTTASESPADIGGQEEIAAEDYSPSDEEQGEQTEQETEQPAGQPQQAQQPQQPEFDYTRAYNELRRDYTRKAQELAAIRRQQQAPQQQQGQGDNTDAFWTSMQSDPIGTIARISEVQAQVKAQELVAPIYEHQAEIALGQNLEKVVKDYPQMADPQEMTNLFNKVSEIAQEVGNPNLARYPSNRILRLAAQELYGNTAAQVYKQAKQAGQDEALNNIRQKQGLSVNAGVKPPPAQKSIEDEIADSIVSSGRKSGIFG